MRRIALIVLFLVAGILLGEVPIGRTTVGRQVVDAGSTLLRWVGHGTARTGRAGQLGQGDVIPGKLRASNGAHPQTDDGLVTEDDKRSLQRLLR